MEQLRAGATLQGRYVVDRVLGRGGMGAVYLARHASLGNRPVAIKAMSIPMLSADDRARAAAQFRAEAEMLSRLRHPGLVTVFDFFVEGDQDFLVMELVDGTTLAEVVEGSGEPPALTQVLDWTDQLCDVLEYLHGQEPPVLFRDLKPANVMVERGGRLRVIDFGIAKATPASGQTATFIRGAGTPGFAPVEQMGMGRTDPRSDIYALGATTYYLLTRRIPPHSVDLLSGEASLLPVSMLNPRVPGAVDPLLQRMMAPRKEQRFQTVREVRAEIALLRAAVEARDGARRFCGKCGGLAVEGACRACGAPTGGRHVQERAEAAFAGGQPPPLVTPAEPPVPPAPPPPRFDAVPPPPRMDAGPPPPPRMDAGPPPPPRIDAGPPPTVRGGPTGVRPEDLLRDLGHDRPRAARGGGGWIIAMVIAIVAVAGWLIVRVSAPGTRAASPTPTTVASTATTPPPATSTVPEATPTRTVPPPPVIGPWTPPAETPQVVVTVAPTVEPGVPNPNSHQGVPPSYFAVIGEGTDVWELQPLQDRARKAGYGDCLIIASDDYVNLPSDMWYVTVGQFSDERQCLIRVADAQGKGFTEARVLEAK